MKLSRRGVLAGAAVGGGLLVAHALQPRSFAPPLGPAPGEIAFGVWIKIARDGVVTVAVPQLEMGQGVTTVLPQIVAQELGADWRQIAVEPAAISGAYANVPLAAEWAPLWAGFLPSFAAEGWAARNFAEDRRFCATAAGTSLAAYEQPCREAAATARVLLAMVAADRWKVGWQECDTANGFVFQGDRRLSFGELAGEAAGFDPPDPPPLRVDAAAEVPRPRGVDTPLAFPRLDLPAKVKGSLQFAGDVRLPGMVYAAIRQGPVAAGGAGTELSGFNSAATSGQKGLVGVVKGKRWLAAAATSWWAAERALDAMAPQFRGPSLAQAETIEQALDGAMRGWQAQRIASIGGGDTTMGRPTLSLRYDVDPATHATLETATATARITDGRLELWTATQAPEQTRRAAARAVDVALADTVLYPMPAGGSFDRRLEHDHAIQAAVIAQRLGRPVQLIWSRWQETLAGLPRTPVAALLTARCTADGTIAVWRARLALPPTAREFGKRLFDGQTQGAARDAVAGEADPLAVAGAVPPYGIPDIAVDHVPTAVGIPTGRMRGNTHGFTAFFTETFIDELAHRFGREPLSYRIAMLGGDLRLAECLQRAARLGEWDGGTAQSGQGLACHRMQLGAASGRIALVATARRDTGGLQVDRLSAAVDIGRIVNLDVARQQIEGGLIYGLGLARGSGLRYARGLPTEARLADLSLPVLEDCPAIAIDFVASDAPPFDPGELGVAVVAPAVANALYSATGLRFRRLPLLSEGL